MSTETKTTAWSGVRATRPVDEAAVTEHVARKEVEERAYRLREIREEQSVTQKELGERMALTQPTISALESGADAGARKLVLSPRAWTVCPVPRRAVVAHA